MNIMCRSKSRKEKGKNRFCSYFEIFIVLVKMDMVKSIAFLAVQLWLLLLPCFQVINCSFVVLIDLIDDCFLSLTYKTTGFDLWPPRQFLL